MKLTKKQRIALEFLAEVGPVIPSSVACSNILFRLYRHGLTRTDGETKIRYHITRNGRKALKEAQK